MLNAESDSGRAAPPTGSDIGLGGLNHWFS